MIKNIFLQELRGKFVAVTLYREKKNSLINCLFYQNNYFSQWNLFQGHRNRVGRMGHFLKRCWKYSFWKSPKNMIYKTCLFFCKFASKMFWPTIFTKMHQDLRFWETPGAPPSPFIQRHKSYDDTCIIWTYIFTGVGYILENTVYINILLPSFYATFVIAQNF